MRIPRAPIDHDARPGLLTERNPHHDKDLLHLWSPIRRGPLRELRVVLMSKLKQIDSETGKPTTETVDVNGTTVIRDVSSDGHGRVPRDDEAN